MSEFLHRWVIENEPDLLEEQRFKANLGKSILFVTIAQLINKKYGKRVIIIIDEMDYPLNAYVINFAGKKKLQDMVVSFNSILTTLAPSSTSNKAPIARVILFGIHFYRDVLRNRSWLVHTCREENIVRFFMFTQEDVKAILKRYNLEGRLSDVEENYGNYTGGFFSPASVIAFVERGELKLYKWCRRSQDVLDINMKNAESILSPFIQTPVVRKRVETYFTTLSLTASEDRMLNLYISADLLCVSGEQKYSQPGVYNLTYGNRENLNIIAFFMERIVGNVSSQVQLDECARAMQKSDFATLAKCFTRLFESFKPIELTSERCYQNSMKVYFMFLDYTGWKIDSEQDEKTMNETTGDSGRTDLRLVNDQLKYLYIFELKFIIGKEVTANPNKIEQELENAFLQIKNRRVV